MLANIILDPDHLCGHNNYNNSGAYQSRLTFEDEKELAVDGLAQVKFVLLIEGVACVVVDGANPELGPACNTASDMW